MPETTPKLPKMLEEVQRRLDEVKLNREFFGANAFQPIENSQRDIGPLKTLIEAVMTLHAPTEVDLFHHETAEKIDSVIICAECQRFAEALDPKAEERVFDDVRYPCATVRAATKEVKEWM